MTIVQKSRAVQLFSGLSAASSFQIAASVATAGILLGTAHRAEAAFIGPYALPGNWTLTNINADGFVNTTPPDELVLTGGNNSSGNYGRTLYSIVAATSGAFSFDWLYTTDDDLPFFDPAKFINNSVVTDLAATGGAPVSGTFNFSVNAGQTFGFIVDTTDNRDGRGTLTISNFSAGAATSVPEPFTVIGTLIGGTAAFRMKKKLGS